MTTLHHHQAQHTTKGVYPQSDESLAMIDTDALKGFISLYAAQVRANVYILERHPIGVHSISMGQTRYMDRPEIPA